MRLHSDHCFIVYSVLVSLKMVRPVMVVQVFFVLFVKIISRLIHRQLGSLVELKLLKQFLEMIFSAIVNQPDRTLSTRPHCRLRALYWSFILIPISWFGSPYLMPSSFNVWFFRVIWVSSLSVL